MDPCNPFPVWDIYNYKVRPGFKASNEPTTFDALTAQSKELTSIAQSVAAKTAEPIKDSVTKVFNKAA